MRKITPILIVFIIGSSGLSCGKKMKIDMPDLRMPKMLKAEEPQVKIRQQIEQVLKATDEPAFHRRIADLLDLARDLKWDNRRLLTAIVEHAAVIPATGEQVTHYHRLLEVMRVPRSTVVDAIAQRLETDSASTGINRALLRWAAPPDPRRGIADYSSFRHHLETRKPAAAGKLVQWMFEHDPSAALSEMLVIEAGSLTREQAAAILRADLDIAEMAGQHDRGLLARDRVSPQAIAAVTALGQFDLWWVKAYVAQILHRYPGLAAKAAL